MQINEQDRRVLRGLAERYSEIAHEEVQQQRLERYRQTNAMADVRPVVLIDEVPWGEIEDEALRNVCAPDLSWLETHLRRTVYQWEHFQVDLVVPPVYRIIKRTRQRRGIGIEVQDRSIASDTGTYAAAHAYVDQLRTEDDLAKLHPPEIVYDESASSEALEVAEDVFAGLMDVTLVGWSGLQASLWDRIARLRGVDNLLMDLAERPDFMHKTVQRFMQLAQSEFKQYEEQGILDPHPVLLHCTAACTRDLPAEDFDGRVRMKDVWGRCAAQIFGSVSPAMHDEFDLAYNEQLFKNCGLVYYGCCEPMDRKIDILRKRFRNLRKISITPWANPERAAESMGADYVLAAKPNPSFVAMPRFDPDPVKQEIARYCEACQSHGTTVEFVLKDISTIANNPNHLTQWAATVDAVLDRYYG